MQGIFVSPERKTFLASNKKCEEDLGGIQLWHRRLDHVEMDRVKKISSGIVDGIDMNEKDQRIKCTLSIDAKQTKYSATGTLVKWIAHHIVHSHIIGPNQPRTIGGARYILCFIV